jgi:EpsI family protein
LSVRQPWKPVEAKDASPPIFAGADRSWHQAYSDGATTIYLTLGYFASERPGAEVASSSHRFTSGAPSVETGEHWQDASVAQNPLYVRALTLATKTNRRLVWYWLWVDGSYTGNPYLAKLMQLKVKLLGGPQPAAIISISADYKGSEDSTAAALAAFTHSLGTIDTVTN